MKLKEIAYAHYLPAKRKRRRANTIEGYESALRCHVVPRFGDMELGEITHEMIQEWVDSFELPGAARKAYKTLRQVIRWAIPNLDIRIYDPTQGIELPAMRPYRPQALEPSEVKATLRGFFGSEMEPTVLLSTCLGLRPGECYALEWRDIDMRTGAVRICKTLIEAKGLPFLCPPKTAKSNRVVYLPRFARDRIRAIWRERERPKGRIIGDMSPHRAARLIRAHCRRNGLPYVPMYARRHTWATLAVGAGVALETVALMLGHSDTSTAYEHYLVPRRETFEEAQRGFAAALVL